MLDFNKALTQDALADTFRRQTVDVEDVRQRVHADAEGFVRWLFSGRAFISRGEARLGDVYGSSGGSLSISLRGAKAGLWIDHATNQHGDLLSLYCEYMGYGQPQFGQALKEIAHEFLGDVVDIGRAPWEESAARRIERKAKELGTQPRADMVELGPKVADWKYRDLHGNIIASVARYEPNGPDSKTYRPFSFRMEDGRAVWKMGAPSLRPLYRLPEIVTCQTVVLAEGEKSAQALADLGVDATTAMQGAHAPIEKTDWSPIQGKRVIIWPDNDEPGQEYARRVAAHLKAIGCTVLMVAIPDGRAQGWDAADCIEEGGDARAILSSASPAPMLSRIRLYTLDELSDLPPPRWLIDGVLTAGGLSQIWAGSDSFKSFVAIDMMMAVATGSPWQGRAVDGGLVIYICAEGAAGAKMRMLGWQATKGKDRPKPRILILPNSFTLVSEDSQLLTTAIASLEEKPKLIIIDTLARTFGTGNENATQDMNAYVVAADRLKDLTGANVMIIHHTGKDGERERGNVALRGACDTIISVKRDGATVKLVNEAPQGKQKDAEPFPTIALRMQQVRFDYRGEEQTTLIAMTDDNPISEIETETLPSSAPRLGQIEKSIITALEKAARGGRTELGHTSLSASLHVDGGSLRRSLRKLIDKNLIVEKQEEHGNRKLYALQKTDVCS